MQIANPFLEGLKVELPSCVPAKGKKGLINLTQYKKRAPCDRGWLPTTTADDCSHATDRDSETPSKGRFSTEETVSKRRRNKVEGVEP